MESITIANRGAVSAATLAHLERHIEGGTEESLRLTEWITGELGAIHRIFSDIKPELKQEKDLMDKIREYIRYAKAIFSFKIKKIFEWPNTRLKEVF